MNTRLGFNSNILEEAKKENPHINEYNKACVALFGPWIEREVRTQNSIPNSCRWGKRQVHCRSVPPGVSKSSNGLDGTMPAN